MQGPLSTGASEMRGRGRLTFLWEVAADSRQASRWRSTRGAFTGWKCLQNRPKQSTDRGKHSLTPAFQLLCGSVLLFLDVSLWSLTSQSTGGLGTSCCLQDWLMVIKMPLLWPWGFFILIFPGFLVWTKEVQTSKFHVKEGNINAPVYS